jgi:hypothetical protein
MVIEPYDAATKKLLATDKSLYQASSSTHRHHQPFQTKKGLALGQLIKGCCYRRFE